MGLMRKLSWKGDKLRPKGGVPPSGNKPPSPRTYSSDQQYNNNNNNNSGHHDQFNNSYDMNRSYTMDSNAEEDIPPSSRALQTPSPAGEDNQQLSTFGARAQDDRYSVAGKPIDLCLGGNTLVFDKGQWRAETLRGGEAPAQVIKVEDSSKIQAMEKELSQAYNDVYHLRRDKQALNEEIGRLQYKLETLLDMATVTMMDHLSLWNETKQFKEQISTITS